MPGSRCERYQVGNNLAENMEIFAELIELGGIGRGKLVYPRNCLIIIPLSDVIGYIRK